VWPQANQIYDGEVRLSPILVDFDSGHKAIEIAIQQSAPRHIPSRSDHFAPPALVPRDGELLYRSSLGLSNRAMKSP